MLGEHMAQALARAVAPAGDDDIQALRPQSLNVRDRGVEDVGALVLPLGGEISSGPSAAIDRVGGVGRRLERSEPRQRLRREPLLPLVFAHVEPGEGQRLIVRLDRILRVGRAAGRIVVGDEGDALVRRILGASIEHERRIADIVEQSVEAFVEQRQPVLEADRAPPFADRGVEVVVAGRRAEFLGVGLSKAADRFRGQPRLAHRDEIERAQLRGRALGLRIEGADRLERIAEKVEPDRRPAPGG